MLHLLTLSLALALSPSPSLWKQDRAFSFLSYKDTIFAIRERNTWTATPRLTEFPSASIELEVLGIGRISGRYPAAIEGYDTKAGCYNVACEDFEHVMGWLADPRFPRPIRPAPQARKAMRSLALKLLAAQGNSSIVLKDSDVYSVDLDGSGKEVRLVDVSAKSREGNPGLVFLDSASTGTRTLTYVKDGRPKVLTVADLLQDGVMEVIVGGITSAGKTVSMWRLDHGRLTRLAGYDSQP